MHRYKSQAPSPWFRTTLQGRYSVRAFVLAATQLLPLSSPASVIPPGGDGQSAPEKSMSLC